MGTGKNFGIYIAIKKIHIIKNLISYNILKFSYYAVKNFSNYGSFNNIFMCNKKPPILYLFNYYKFHNYLITDRKVSLVVTFV